MVSLAASWQEDGNTAAERARRLTQERPADPWSWFALAGTQEWHRRSDQDDEKMVATSTKALAMMPHHPDFIWLRAQSLFLSVKHAGEVPAFVDAHLQEVGTVYVQRGGDENLVEEFSWRVEELKRR